MSADFDALLAVERVYNLFYITEKFGEYKNVNFLQNLNLTRDQTS
jgi:hypothetical protein